MGYLRRSENDHINSMDTKKEGIQQRSVSLEAILDVPSFFIPYENERVLSIDQVYPIYNYNVTAYLNVGDFLCHMQKCRGELYSDEIKLEGIRFRSYSCPILPRSQVSY